MSLDIFQRSSGLTQVARKSSLSPQEALSALSVKRWHSSVVAQCGVIPWENSSTCITFTAGLDQSSAIVHLWGVALRLDSGSELGKSQGYSFRQI
jgi:hypothetical protein